MRAGDDPQAQHHTEHDIRPRIADGFTLTLADGLIS